MLTFHSIPPYILNSNSTFFFCYDLFLTIAIECLQMPKRQTISNMQYAEVLSSAIFGKLNKCEMRMLSETFINEFSEN